MSRPASRTSSPNRSTTRPSSSGSSSCSHSESNSHSPTRPDQPIPTSTTTPNTSITCSTQSPVPATTHYYPSPSSSSSTPWSTTTTTRVDPSYVNAPILSEYLEQNFVPSVVPLPEEYQAKEQARQYLEKLVQTISPGSKLLPFGSMANGFALKNSDMDLCCFLGKDAPVRQPSELVEQLGTLIERETNFYVKMLPRARIPIIKLNMPPTSTIPEGMACDIGFENRLALENTRLLLTYAMVDPRLRTLVLFLKVWTKRRKINNPYRGTLSSYGYVLLVIHFLSHVIKPRVVPNLQRLPLPDSTPLEDLTYQGHDISFFDDLDQLSQVFPELGTNLETSGELLIDFFKYFANGFDYAKSVISIRSDKGTLGKEEKGWNSDIEFDPEMIVRDSHKLCIEDPFALDYNVARTVTKDGLYTIRGEFMRAVRILTTSLPRNTQSGDRITAIMNELCAEREDFLLMHPPPGEHHHHHHHPPHHNNHKSPLLQSSTSPFHPPSSPAPHSQQQSSAATSSLPISKSPRRRSAPSPQLRPAPPPAPHSHHLVAPPPPSNQQEYNPSPTPTSSSGRSSQINGNGVKVSTEDGTTTPASGYDARRHLQPPSYPVSRTSPVPSPSASQYHSPTPSSVSSSVAGDAVLDRRSSFENSSQTQTTLTGSGTNSTTNQYDLHRFFQNPPSSSSSTSTTTTGVAPSSSSVSDVGTNSHHHHQQGGYYHHHPRTTVSLTAPSSPDLTPASYYHNNNNNNSGGGYHQNGGHYSSRNPYRYPSSGYPSTNSSSSSSRHASVPRNPHQHHHQQQHHHQPHYATTLNPYANPPAPAYPLASTSTSTNSGGGNSASSSSSSSPYPPYPLSSSSNSNMTPSSSAASTTTIPSTTTSGGPVVIENSNSPLLPLPPPRPIFPLEDRETIARASSITFGNFPTSNSSSSSSSSLNSFDFLPPLPRDFAHYHALGGSNAYLSGNGGWGIQPYGMGMNSNGNGNVAPHSSSMMMMMMMQQQQQQQQEEEEEEQRRGGGGGKLEDQSVVVVGGGEDQEDDQDVGSITSQFDLEDSISTTTTTPPGTTTGTGESINETTRGRSFINGGSGRLEHLNHVPSSNSSHRQRGRSVPQTRMGPDGREYVLFGAIQVTLPKPEDVEAVESELERQEREQDVKGLSEEEEEDEEKEQEVVAKQEQVDQKKEEEKEEKSVIESQLGESVPTLMTSPPTPAKPAYTACRPLSPLFNATPVPTSTCNNNGVVVQVEVEEEIDLDRTPRPASPRPLPDLNSSSSSSDPSTPSTPTRSKHAAKRARQNERRKVAQSSSSTPPTPASPRPLALTSNSLV